jgi:hypothetical protein
MTERSKAKSSMHTLSGLRPRAGAFFRNTAGNVAIIMALSALPLTLAMGAGIDYARGLAVHSNMTDALDAAGLAVGAATTKPASTCSSDGSTSSTTGNGTTSSPTSCSTVQQLAQQYFNANFNEDSSADAVGKVSISYNSGSESVVLSVTDSVPTTFLAAADKLMGTTKMDSMAVSASSTVVWGQTKLWVALVLDNTGSMNETDSTGTSKISALKTAANNLITTLQGASATVGDVQMSVVPFAKLVNIGTSYVNSPYIDWTDWKAAPVDGSGNSVAPAVTLGPGDACPWSTGSQGFQCVNSPGSSSTTSTVPSSGTYSGYVCPSVVSVYSATNGRGGHYFNGCYTSVANGTQTTVSTGSRATCGSYHNCSCSGSGSSKTCKTNNYTHTWTPNATSTWKGCIEDRPQDYDTNNTAPTSSTTNFPAANDDNCAIATVTPLPANWTTAQWTTLSNQINSMTANGSTNQTIGLAHGWQTLTNAGPYSAPALPANTSQYIIEISDGLNTQDRWYGDGSDESGSVDTRMSDACANAKAAGITIYTIFVDLNGTQGNSTVLQNCATDSSKYFDLTTSGAIITTLNSIGQQITSLRVSN